MDSNSQQEKMAGHSNELYALTTDVLKQLHELNASLMLGIEEIKPDLIPHCKRQKELFECLDGCFNLIKSRESRLLAFCQKPSFVVVGGNHGKSKR